MDKTENEMKEIAKVVDVTALQLTLSGIDDDLNIITPVVSWYKVNESVSQHIRIFIESKSTGVIALVYYIHCSGEGETTTSVGIERLHDVLREISNFIFDPAGKCWLF